MMTGEIKNKIDSIWNDFWAGGVANPLSVMEQMTYLLFIKRLDDLHMLEERKSQTLKIPMERRIFPEGKFKKNENDEGIPYDHLRWSWFKNQNPPEMMRIVDEYVFPFLRSLGEEGSSYGKHMQNARLGFSNPALLDKVVQKLDQIKMDDRDTKGDVYEYMLGMIASAGKNGQFRTPRHIIQLMVEMTKPTPTDVICDPASGTCGFLVAAGEYLRVHHPEIFRDKKLKAHFHGDMFHGFDFDTTMLRIGAMNMILHGVEDPKVEFRDSLAEDHTEDAGRYSLVLANPPFAGSLDYESCAKDLQKIVKTKKTELLFAALFLRLLRNGGRAAVIVPSGVLESDSAAHKSIRKQLLENNTLEGIILLPHWVFKPYASVSTAIMLFTKSGKTDSVWFYRMENDGYKDDSAKTAIDGSEISEILKLWNSRHSAQYKPKPKKHRFVSIKEIIENDYDLCTSVYLSGYKYPEGVPLKRLEEYFDIQKGTIGAANANDGEFNFITSSEELKKIDRWTHEGEGIFIPIVSSTGHGHASIKHVHYFNGKFSAATITAMLLPKNKDIYVPYVYYYLLAHKDELLVPLMRGAANVSLNLDRLKKLKIPVPLKIEEQKRMVSDLVLAKSNLEKIYANLNQTEEIYKNSLHKLKSNY